MQEALDNNTISRLLKTGEKDRLLQGTREKAHIKYRETQERKE